MEKDIERVIYEKYKELACTVIISIINDWLDKENSTEYGLYYQLKNCTWFDYLDLDMEYIYVQVLNLKKKGIKKIKGINYGKSNNL